LEREVYFLSTKQNGNKSRCSRYGNELTLLDATYKTTKYALPLYFVVVKTNIDYQVVGSFVTQSETSEDIREALGILRDWSNNKCCPAYFMVDCAEEEITAIQETFSSKYINIFTTSYLFGGIDRDESFA
jgi:hypothetical protein